jgi:hypothetical protein
MDLLIVLGGMVVVWLPGVFLLYALHGRDTAPGSDVAWRMGAGWFAGVLLLTLWMHALAFAGIQFSFGTIAGPLIIAGAGAVWLVVSRKRMRIGIGLWAAWDAVRGEGAARWSRMLWLALLAWLSVRALLLLTEIILRPLYPWEAWTRWATKARVYYEVGTIVPFGNAESWFATSGALWFDASPREPLLVPLLETWTAIVLGRFDDTLIAVPWWLSAVAISLALYGALRGEGLARLAALASVWILASLPLWDTHVALAGYADLFLAAFVSLAALAMLRYRATRSAGDGIESLLFLGACPMCKLTGWLWVVALLPGMLAAWRPALGWRIAAFAFGTLGAALVILARTQWTVLGHPLYLEFAPDWATLAQRLFLLDNWHLLWVGVIVIAFLGWRCAVAPELFPLSLIIGGGLLYAFVVFVFPKAADWLSDGAGTNRTLLVLAPLECAWLALTTRAWTVQWIDRRRPGAPA